MEISTLIFIFIVSAKAVQVEYLQLLGLDLLLLYKDIKSNFKISEPTTSGWNPCWGCTKSTRHVFANLTYATYL